MSLVDPIAELERMSRHQTAETDAARAIQKARVKLVLGKDAPAAFFATLALRMKPTVDWELETAATDGRTLFYNPEFILSLSPEQRVGLLAHEVMHNAMAHGCRREGRDMPDWNVACDLAINGIVQDAGMQLPPGALFPGQGNYSDMGEGWAAEEYYGKLPHKNRKDGEEGDGDGSGEGDGQGNDPGKCGGVKDAGDPSQQQTTQADWKVAVAQAATAAKGRGELPGGLGRLVEEIVNPKVPWQDELREFVSRTLTARDDYTWGAPNRRFIAQGLYLPSLRSEAMGDVVVAIDTSGSIEADTLESFGGELNGILECRPCKVSVVYCDSHVNKVVEWEPSDGELKLEACGGGGTSHRPVWEWLRQSGSQPECVVCLTDGYTSWGDDPGVPVLWAITPDGTSEKPPFGRVIRM